KGIETESVALNRNEKGTKEEEEGSTSTPPSLPRGNWSGEVIYQA
ncbi:hypothetical protein CSA_023507, partial [Cucumis sativus]